MSNSILPPVNNSSSNGNDSNSSSPQLTSWLYSPEAAMHRPVELENTSNSPYALANITQRSLPYMHSCRNFAFITGVFGGSECLVEKYRGKHDMWNPSGEWVYYGSVSGPQAMAIGCGGFAAFLIVIDSFMGHY